MKKAPLLTLAFISSVAAFTVYSCRKDKSYPVEPHIEYMDFVKYSGHDSAEFKIMFTDGDGDIGLDKGDTLAPFNKGSKYFNNIYLVYQYKDSLGYHYYTTPPVAPDTIPDTLQFAYRIPVITPFGQSKSLNGEIHVRLYAPYAAHNNFRFKCYIYDRALHQSNIIDSPDFTP